MKKSLVKSDILFEIKDILGEKSEQPEPTGKRLRKLNIENCIMAFLI